MADAPTPAVNPPMRNVLAGGVVGVLTWSIIFGFNKFGIVLDPSIQTAIPLILAFIVAHFVPPSAQDIVSRVNDQIVRLANADQSNPTQAIIVGEQASLLQAHSDVANGLVPPVVLPPKPIPGVVIPPKGM